MKIYKVKLLDDKYNRYTRYVSYIFLDEYRYHFQNNILLVKLEENKRLSDVLFDRKYIILEEDRNKNKKFFRKEFLKKQLNRI